MSGRAPRYDDSHMPLNSPPVLTLLTDFGSDDYYVAAVKGIVLTRVPGATIVDIAHSVPPGAVAAGSWLLAAAARWFPPGTVHLAVVDPGVGSERRMLAAAAGGAFFVGPDNGLLSGVLEAGAEIRSVDRPDLYLPGPGQTFHGRDRFSPVAAALAAGEPLARLGPLVDDPVRLAVAAPRCEGDPGQPGTVLQGRITWVDRFGNLVTDLPVEWLGERPAEATVGSHRAVARAAFFAEVRGSEAAILPGSLGTVELAVPGGDLARRWCVGIGAQVSIRLR
jgi:S-adenosylmethionine hydrolase